MLEDSSEEALDGVQQKVQLMGVHLSQWRALLQAQRQQQVQLRAELVEQGILGKVEEWTINQRNRFMIDHGHRLNELQQAHMQQREALRDQQQVDLAHTKDL